MAQKTFLAQSKKVGNSTSNSYNQLKEYLKGKRIKILNASNGHNYGSIGTIIEIPSNHESMAFGGGSGNNYNNVSNLVPGKNNISFSSFVVLEAETSKEIEEYIKELEKEKKEKIEELNSKIENEKLKIEFLKETKNEKFDEDEFKSFKALSLLENKELSILEKSKILAKLIKG